MAELDAQGLFAEGQRLYENEKYRRAIEYFQSVVFNYPGNAVVDSAQYYLGLSYFGNEEYELAAIEFNRLTTNYPSSEFFVNAMFMRAVSFYEATPENPGLDQTDLQKAIDQLQDFLIDFPESELVSDVKQYLSLAQTRMAKKFYNAGMVYERIGAWEAAKIYYQKVVDEYAGTELGPLAAFHKALMEMKQKNFSEARTHFEAFATAFPDHELTAKARENAVEAAFRNCRKSFEAGKYTEARQCLQDFSQAYPGNGFDDDAADLLQKIEQQPDQSETPEHAGS